MAQNIVASVWIRTTSSARCISQCQATVMRHSSAFTTSFVRSWISPTSTSTGLQCQSTVRKDRRQVYEARKRRYKISPARDQHFLVLHTGSRQHDSDQASPTEETMRKTKHFLDYMASHPDAILTFSASSMVPAMHNNTSYLTEP